MTFQQWHEKYKIPYGKGSGESRFITDELKREALLDLYVLSDYKVSSRAGGTIYLVKI